MNDSVKFSTRSDVELSSQDLMKRLTIAELRAETAEMNAVAAERARSIIHAELRAVQSERDRLKMDIIGLKSRLEHTANQFNDHVDHAAVTEVAEVTQEELLFSWRLAQPLGKVADFDLLHLKGRSLVVHPVAFETVVAELNFSPSESISMIKMEVSLPDARAQAVEYALVAAGAPITTDTPVNPDVSWSLLTPEESAEVILNFPTMSGQVNALLYVRMQDSNNGHDYSGTLWRTMFST